MEAWLSEPGEDGPVTRANSKLVAAHCQFPEESSRGDPLGERKYWIGMTEGPAFRNEDTIRVFDDAGVRLDSISKNSLVVNWHWYSLLEAKAGLNGQLQPPRYKRLPKVQAVRVSSLLKEKRIEWKMLAKNNEIGMLASNAHDIIMSHNVDNKW